MGVNHISYGVVDYTKTRDFYADLFGMKVSKDNGKRRGLEPRPDTENSFHVKDPDGFDLQISGKDMKA